MKKEFWLPGLCQRGLGGFPKKDKEHYWIVVKKCLVKFHGIHPKTAEKLIRDKWTPEWLKKCGLMIYHNEAWDLACNLVESDLSRLDYMEAYDKLQDEVYGL